MGEHLIDGEFQSDKYPECPPGKVPLSTKDPDAQPLLWIYAQRRRPKDPEFSADLEEALRLKGYVPQQEQVPWVHDCETCGSLTFVPPEIVNTIRVESAHTPETVLGLVGVARDTALHDKVLELRNASIKFGKMGQFYVPRKDIDKLCDEILALAK